MSDKVTLMKTSNTHMETLKKNVSERLIGLEQLIFQRDLKTFSSQLAILTEELYAYIQSLSLLQPINEAGLLECNQTLERLIAKLQQKDYVELFDIVRFELVYALDRL